MEKTPSTTPVADEMEHLRANYSTRDRLDTLSNYAGLIALELEDAVHDARREGMSWTEVGALLGVSKQAAQQRYGRQ